MLSEDYNKNTELVQWSLIMVHDENKILTLKEVAQELRLDPRTVKEVAFALGGRRIGYRWSFQWLSTQVFQQCRR